MAGTAAGGAHRATKGWHSGGRGAPRKKVRRDGDDLRPGGDGGVHRLRYARCRQLHVRHLHQRPTADPPEARKKGCERSRGIFSDASGLPTKGALPREHCLTSVQCATVQQYAKPTKYSHSTNSARILIGLLCAPVQGSELVQRIIRLGSPGTVVHDHHSFKRCCVRGSVVLRHESHPEASCA